MTDYNDLTIEDIERALSFVSSDTPRDEWVRVLSAVKSELGDGGKDICYEWSRDGYEKFKATDFNNAWKNIKSLGGVKIGTLIYEAKKAGFKLGTKRQKISEDEIAKREAAKLERQAEEQRQADEEAAFSLRVSDFALTLWEQYSETIEHDYLARKRIKPHNTRVGRWPKYSKALQVFEWYDNTLIIPMFNKDGLYGLQGITADKKTLFDGNVTDKHYMLGLGKSGLFAKFGDQPKNRVIICEGWATGASIHEATGEFVMVAFDCGQLRDKCRVAREMWPDLPILIAADNDQFTKGNPGLKMARSLMSEFSHLTYIYPEFDSLEGEPTDFNDLHIALGLPAVKSYFQKQPLTIKKDAPLVIDFNAELPNLAANKKPLSTIENLAEILRRMHVNVRYNVIKKDEELIIPGESFTMDNAKNASLARIFSRCSQFGMPTGNISDFLTYLADQNQYNPVVSWVNSAPWDGVDRLTEFLSTVKSNDVIEVRDGEMLHEILIKRWMISAVAAAFSPNGIASAGVLVFQGAQGLGKTKWFKSLAPQDLDFTKDGLQLRLDDKDSVKEALSYWLVELGELDGTFNKSEMSALKAFLTKDADEMRMAYARKSSRFARRTIFFASVNPDDFLRDPTGSRRFWVIPCEEIDYNHTFDMQQVWAQVHQLWLDGESYYLDQVELDALNEKNKDFTEISPISELIDSQLNWSAPVKDWKWRTATEILVSINYQQLSTHTARQCGQAVFKLNEGQKRKSNGKQLLLCPPARDYFQRMDQGID